MRDQCLASTPEAVLQVSVNVAKGRVPKKNRIFYGLLPNPPSDPPSPPGMVFLRIKKLPLFFLSEIRSQMGETNFTFGPIPKSYFFVL